MISLEMNTSRICTDLLQKLPRRKSIHLESATAHVNLQDVNRHREKHVRITSSPQERSVRQLSSSARPDTLIKTGKSMRISLLKSLPEKQPEYDQWCIPKCFEAITVELLKQADPQSFQSLTRPVLRRTRKGESLMFQLLQTSIRRPTPYTDRVLSDTIYYVLHGSVLVSADNQSVGNVLPIEVQAGSSIRVQALEKLSIHGQGNAAVLVISDTLNLYSAPRSRSSSP